MQRERPGCRSLTRALLRRHSLLDVANDDHENGAANTRAGYIANETTDIEAACWGASSRRNATGTHERTQDLTAEAATHEPRNRVADGAEALLFEHATGDVATHSTTNQANDQTDDAVHMPSFPQCLASL